MTKTETNAFRKTLEAKQKELQNANRAQPIEIEATSDELDRIQQASERDYAIGSLERNFSRLREVGEALRRLDAGDLLAFALVAKKIYRRSALRRCLRRPFCIVCQEAADNERMAPSLELDESLLATV